MRLLITNDDGIDAPGLAALLRATQGFGERIVVAPASPCSGCGHQVTTHAPVRWEPRSVAGTVAGWAVHGTPADCVRLALHAGRTGRLPRVDWVLSGINAGGNLGADVHHSGTVAAAREAAMRGLPAVAFSHYKRRGADFEWGLAAHWTANLLSDLLAAPPEGGWFWNVNLPHLERAAIDAGGSSSNQSLTLPMPEVLWCPLEPGPLPSDYREEAGGYVYSGVYQQRDRRPGSDVDVCFAGGIAVTELRAV